MTLSLTANQIRLQQLLNGIAILDPDTRKTKIVELRILMKNLTEQQIIDAIKPLTKPSELRFLIPAGIYGAARSALINMLINFEVKGIK